MGDKDKKYYWLKLKRDFFKRHDIRIIEEMKDGKEIVLFYLKLICESVDHEGRLRFSDEIPYTVDMLAAITNTQQETAAAAIKILCDLKMLEVDSNGTYTIKGIEKVIGSETSWAEKKRAYREAQAAEKRQPEETEETTRGQDEDKRRTKKDFVRQEKEKEIEIEKELDIETEKEKKNNYQLIADLYNEICISLPRVVSLSNERKKAIKARLNIYSVEDFKKLFETAEASDFLKGANGRNWTANFDWLIKDANMAKVLDGNYNNRNKPNTNSAADNLGNFYDMMSDWAQEGNA